MPGKLNKYICDDSFKNYLSQLFSCLSLSFNTSQCIRFKHKNDKCQIFTEDPKKLKNKQHLNNKSVIYNYISIL